MNYDCSKCDVHFECNATAACRCDNENVFLGVWHPYPSEEPPITDGYMVTRMHPVMDEEGKLQMQRVTMHYCYDKDSKSWLRKGVPLPEGTVLAWAEIPKPYEEKQ